jgi:DMSO/TMAO reductase YedYZ molybdopterin-dependent catalytic subunit
MKGNRNLLTLLLAISCSAIIFPGFQSLCLAEAKTSVAGLPSMSLTIVGPDGTQEVLNETDIGNLASCRGYGGYENSLGFLKGLGNYTGVPLSTLCDLVGGLTNASTVKVTASDNYSKDFTFDEVMNGNFTTFDPATAMEVPHFQPLVPIVAYYFNDTNIGSSDGPLRLAIVGSEGLATNSSYWVKWVEKVEVVDVAVPEFPSSTVLPLLVLATSAVASSFKFRRKRQGCLSQPRKLVE